MIVGEPSPFRRPIDGVLFDLFGTLVNVDATRLPLLSVGGQSTHSTIPAVLVVLRAAVPGLQDADALAAMIDVLADAPRREDHAEIPEHAPFAALLARLRVVDPEDVLARRLADAQMAAVLAACESMPGARTLLRALRAKNIRTAVASNLAHPESLSTLLAVADPEHRFDATVTSGEIGYVKPDRRVFETALARLGVAAANAIHVGDEAKADVLGAAAAGIHPVWFNRLGRSWSDVTGSPPTTVSTLEEIATLLGTPGSIAV